MRQALQVVTFVLLWSVSAGAVPPPGPGDKRFDLDYRAQGQILTLASIPLPDGGVTAGELQLNGSLHGLGVAMGLLVEDVTRDDGARFRGLSYHLAFQYRFVAHISRHVYPYFDPHIDLGFWLGGGELAGSTDEPAFRGAAYVGASIDLPLQFRTNPQVVATVQYRFVMGQEPVDMPAHLLMVGLSFRLTGDLPDPEAKPQP